MARERSRREVSAGGVVFRPGGEAPAFLLILDGHRNWGFPKGHLIGDEQPLDAARREVTEETGLSDLVLHGELGTIDWYFRSRGRLVHKFCHFFLFESVTGEPVPQRDEGITCCAWHGVADARSHLGYANARELLRRAEAMVSQLSRPDSVPGP